jgi:rSAM/selenodomain-associated transferase 2
VTARLLSVVVPTLDEERHLPGLLADVRELADHHEVIVADGGSTDATVALAEAAGARVVHAPRGRGRQLRAGAAAANGDLLLFVHADARLPRLQGRVVLGGPFPDTPRVAFWYPLRIDAQGLRYRLVERAANVRARWLGLPYGDQGLLVHRDLYDAAGGYDPVPLMEDVMLVRRLRKWGELRSTGLPLTVSARRWERDGVARRTLANWAILARWMAGASPESLAARYR